ncbi:MAG: hypothetical protein V5A48_01930 [Salinivenus sp.]
MSVEPRLNRLLASDGRCFDVAIDHGFFNQYPFLTGIEDIGHAIREVCEAQPDAIQLTPGQARVLQGLRLAKKPALVLRTDVANIYGDELPDHLFSELIDRPVEQALSLDAACVVVNLLFLEGAPEVHHACLQNVAELKPRCEQYGMPLMVEPLVMKAGSGGGYDSDGDPEKIIPLVRQGVEMGADLIKADPTDDVSDYDAVIEAAGDVPVLVRGGSKGDDRDVLERTHAIIDQGAEGIVYGRNVIQHETPSAMTAALMAIVHDGATPDEAMDLLRSAS